MAKKIIAVVLAVVLAFSVPVTAFAADTTPSIDDFASAIKADVTSFTGGAKKLKALSVSLLNEMRPFLMDVVLTKDNMNKVMGIMGKLVDKVANRGHVHSFTIEKVCDEAVRTAPTCKKDGVYYKSCSCGAVSTSKKDTFTVVGSHETAPHTLTIYRSDEKEFWNICVLCDYETEHSPLLKPNEPWTTDEGAHWHIGEKEQRIDLGSHIYGKWTTEYVGENEETVSSTCTVCGYVYSKTRYSCKGNHDYQPIVDKQFLRVPAKNHTDAVYCYSCSRCGQADLTQTFSVHNYVNHSDNEYSWSVCEVCEEETEKTPLLMPDSEWKSNEKTHWHKGADGKVDIGIHEEGEWIIDKEAVNKSEPGSKHKECSVCGKVLETEEVQATGITVSDLKDSLSKYIFVKVDDVDEATMRVLRGDGTVDENGNGNGVKYTVVTLDDGSDTVYIAVNIVDHPEIFNYDVFKKVVDNLYAEQGENLIKDENGETDYLMSYEHIAGELAFHAIIYALMNEFIGYTGTKNKTIVGLYLSAAVADLNIDESRVPTSFLSILGVLLVDMFQFNVLRLLKKI